MLSMNNNCEGVQCLVSALFQKGIYLFKVSRKRPIPIFDWLMFCSRNFMLHQKEKLKRYFLMKNNKTMPKKYV